MKPSESVLGEVRKEKTGWVVLGELDDQDALCEYIRKKYIESVQKVILLFELGNEAKGFLVRTESRVLFCVTQNVNKYEEAFMIRWVIDDIPGTALDAKSVSTNEIQVTPNRDVLFDPELISAHRLTEEIREIWAIGSEMMIFPPKKIKTDESALISLRQKALTEKSAHEKRLESSRVSLEELNEAIRSVQFIPERSERGYQVQLYQALAQNYPVEYEGAKKGARFDLTIGKDDVAVELKIVRNSGVFDRTVGQISRYKNEVKRIAVVLIDMTKNPSLIREWERRLVEIDPDNIRVVVK